MTPVRMRYLVLLILAVPLAGDSVIFFRSGFESGAILKAPVRQDGEWSQYLTGADQGFDWTKNLPQRTFPKNRFTTLVSSRSILSRYVDVKLQSVPGHSGTTTGALYMSLKKQDPRASQGTRVQYGIYPPADFKQAYVRYWVKLQPDLATVILPPGTKTSRQITEAKETGDPDADFRWSIYIRRDRGIADLFWGVRAQLGDLGMSPPAWECVSYVPVPVGEWFLFEVFWKIGITDGRLWGAANGKTFVDYWGRTQKDSSLYVWWPFKIYVGTDLESFGGKPLYQWVDDVEFANEPPVALPAVPANDTYSCETQYSVPVREKGKP